MKQLVGEYIAKLRLADEQLEKIAAVRMELGLELEQHMEHIYIFDKNKRYLYVDVLAAQLVGLRPGGMIGKTWRDVGLLPEIMEPFDLDLDKCFAAGKIIMSETSEYQRTIFNGRFYQFVFHPLNNRPEEIEAVLVRVRDITERKQAESKQQHFLKELELLIDATPSSLVALDQNACIRTINKRLLSYLGGNLQKEDLIGKPYENLINLMGLDYETSKIMRAMRGEELNAELIKWMGRDWLLSAVPVREQDGEIYGAMGVFTDITEKETLRKELDRLDKLNVIGEMAAGVAHEIRNPMTVIKGYLQFFKKKVSANMQEQFETVLGELDRVESIITDFLSIARNKGDERQLCDLNTIIEGIYPLIFVDAIKHGVDIKVNLEKGLPLLILNSREIKQLVLNLARNGIEAMGDHGVLTIATSKQDDKITLCISDTGCGICKEDLDKIFTPFYTTKENGTGLGLSVSAGIVERHGGEISVLSEVGLGTQFCIVFKS